MLGLGDYESSDEERVDKRFKGNGMPNARKASEPTPLNVDPHFEPVLGPFVGPTQEPWASQPLEPNSGTSSAPQSPYTADRQLVHSLTLPPIPNVAIPPSPSGLPRPSTSAKFERFLELKTKGIHFNTKLASSSALRNPGLLQSLMEFAEINQEYEQYATTLSPELAVIPPDGFPRSAYAEELDKQAKAENKRRQAEKREGKRPIDCAAASQNSSASGTPKPFGKASENVSGVGRDAIRVNGPESQSRPVEKQVQGRKSRFDDRGKG